MQNQDNNQQVQIPDKFWELYGKKAFTADVQAENIAQLKAENERLRQQAEEKANAGPGEKKQADAS